MASLLRRRAGRPLSGGRPAGATQRLRRLLVPLTVPAVLAAGVVIGAVVGPAADAPATGVLAAWTSSTQASAPVSMARLGSSFSALNTAGTLSGDRLSYRIAGLLTTNTGYLDLVNTSTAPATLSLTGSMGALIGVTPASVCSLPWKMTTGACPGTTTVLDSSFLLDADAVRYTAPTLLPPGGRLHIKVSISGVLNVVTLTARPPVPRAAMDRTHS